jgi:hypothetical protein
MADGRINVEITARVVLDPALAEALAKAEHLEDPTNCSWPYTEHDESGCEVVDGIWGGECRRCGAELGGEI